MSTRAVSAAAGVQSPTIYRQFGDMRGLPEAVARETLAGYVRQKVAGDRASGAHFGDPVAALRQGWDGHVAFGLANPAAYVLIYGDPTAAAGAPAEREGLAILHGLVTRAAEAGRLQVSVPEAARLITAGARGVTLALLGTAPEARDARRDAQFSAAMREAVLAAITVPDAADGVTANTASPRTTDGMPGPRRVAARAVALRAVLAEAPDGLTPAERALLCDWLDRLAGAAGPAEPPRARTGAAGGRARQP